MRRYMYSLVAGLCMAACSETFPGVEGEVPEEKDFNSSEVTNDRIPILLSYNDPNYLILTRGSGPFEDFASDREHWLGAEFAVFAYKLPNSVDASCDFSKRKDYQENNGENNCLLFDRKVKLKTASESALSGDDYLSLEWADKGQYFFNGDRQDYKYGFFLAYCDDAIGGDNWKTSPECVYADVTIDGTQDIITAVAKPSESKMEELKGEKYKDLLANWDDLVFSTFAAHRGLQPQFDVKHELVRLEFSVVPGDPKATGVKLKDIKLIKPKTKARLIVAAQDASRVGVDLSSANADGNNWQLHDKEEENAEPPYLKPIVLNYVGGQEDRDKQTEIPVGSSFLAFPDKSYQIQLVCEQVRTDKEGNPILDEEGNPKVYHTKPTYVIQMSSGEQFKAGHKYAIRITVYGIQRIEMSMGSSKWQPGTDDDSPIVVDPDDLEANEDYDVEDKTDETTK